MNTFVNTIDFAKGDGIVPVIVQDCKSKEVLMLAYMNAEALEKTLESGFAHYYSRSRKGLWKKGESSGHLQKICSIKLDCDNDTLLLIVEQIGPACHTNHYTCFYREFKDNELIPCSYIIKD